jgi:hypothetical protein
MQAWQQIRFVSVAGLFVLPQSARRSGAPVFYAPVFIKLINN